MTPPANADTSAPVDGFGNPLMRNMILIGLAVSLLACGQAGAETGCTAADASAAHLKSPLIKSQDDAAALARDYFRMATDQRDMFDKRKYAVDVVQTGEIWTASIIFMKRPHYPWEDWKRHGKVGRVTICGFDGRLLGIEATY